MARRSDGVRVHLEREVVERHFFIDNLLVQIHFIIEIIWWTGLAPREYEFPFPGRLISTYLKSKIDHEEFAAEVGVLDMLDRGRKRHHEVQEIVQHLQKLQLSLISHKVFLNSLYLSHPPHKSINLSFTIASIKNNLTDLCGN